MGSSKPSPAGGMTIELRLAAERGGQVIGMIEAAVHRLRPDARWQLQRDLSRTRLVISALAVTTGHRRRGAGTALLQAAEDWGRRKGCYASLAMNTRHHSF